MYASLAIAVNQVDPSSADENEPFCKGGTDTSKDTSDPQGDTEWNYACIRRTVTLPFAIFLVSTLATLLCGMLYIADHDLGYMISGPIGIAVSIYGAKHMRTIINLKGAVDEFEVNNIKFRCDNIF